MGRFLRIIGISNHQIAMTRQEPNINNQSSNNKAFDLEERTLYFSKSVLALSREIPRSLENIEIIKQVVRSAASVGANYREANEAVSKKDFVHRLKICRKESKETGYWLELIIFNNPNFIANGKKLIDESKQLIRIFSSIIEKIETRNRY